MAFDWLEKESAGIAEAVGRRMAARPSGSFAAVGEEACRRHATAALEALRADLTAGHLEALRRSTQALVEELSPHGLRFAELRSFIQALRSAVLEPLAKADAAARPEVDAWFLELAFVASMQFVVQREAAQQQQAAALEVKHLETQLGELKAALAEKSELLERIRQTSTPIAPVVDGILVVPLVGAVDASRTELLTERLLNAVSQSRAHVVILDISGVPVFDAVVAQLIVRLAEAVKLLGAEQILVGMSAATARTIVELGLDLSRLRVLGTLQDGLAAGLQIRRLRIAPL